MPELNSGVQRAGCQWFLLRAKSAALPHFVMQQAGCYKTLRLETAATIAHAPAERVPWQDLWRDVADYIQSVLPRQLWAPDAPDLHCPLPLLPALQGQAGSP